jgi:hypothetical protein
MQQASIGFVSVVSQIFVFSLLLLRVPSEILQACNPSLDYPIKNIKYNNNHTRHIHLVWDRDQWQAVVKGIMEFWVP